MNLEDPNFMTQMKETLDLRKPQIVEDLLFAKECKETERQNTGNCGTFMNKYAITNPTEGAVTLDFIQDQSAITNTCLDIL